jgi:hypothetical protein
VLSALDFPGMVWSLELRAYIKLVPIGIVGNLQNIGSAADLTIFHVALLASGGLIDRRIVPLTATCALKTRVHQKLRSSLIPESGLLLLSYTLKNTS